jgi:thiamine-phosphate pyrophosphorylase
MPSDEKSSARRSALAAARLYLVCDTAPGGRELAAVLQPAIAGGVQVVQLRDKLLPDDELTAAAAAAVSLCRESGALLIVNDRPLVALESGADGVHVGQDDMAVADVRALVGADLLIGLSTHAPAEIDAAGAHAHAHAPSAAGMRRDRADAAASHAYATPDYIGVGPVHETPTKPGRAAVGLELVRYAAAHVAVPFFAIGGIDTDNVGEVIAAGARGVCVLRAIAQAENPEQVARALRERLDAHGGEG